MLKLRFLQRCLTVIGIASFVFFFPKQVLATEFYAAPTGMATNDGTLQKPWDLQTAFNQTTTVKPGDTLWLRGGKYGTGGGTKFITKLAGTKAQPIIIRQVKGEKAVIDGGIETGTGSAFNWFWGFEITNTEPERAWPTSERVAGINMLTVGHKAINMVIHDVGHPGIGFWSGVGDGGEIYGSLLWGNGNYDIQTPPGTPEKPWTRGSPIYAQNKDGSRFIEETITFRNFTTGMKAYTEGGWANGFVFRGNVTFDSGDRILFASGRDNPITTVLFEENFTYRSKTDGRNNVHLGYSTRTGIQAIVKNNYFVGGPGDVLYVNRWQDISSFGNTIVGSGTLASWQKIPSWTLKSNWNNNTYYGGSAKPFKNDNLAVDFTTWKSATGFDANSSYTTSYPTQNKIVVRPNKYEAGRANITVYNWENKDTADIDVSGVLKNGDVYEVRDVQNYVKVIKSGTYDGTPINLPLNLTEVMPLVGTVTHFANVHTSKEFNAFVIRVPARELEVPSLPPSPTPTATPTSCQGDINGDNSVNLSDYSLLVQSFLKTPVVNAKADLNQDGVVNLQDYSIFVGRFLKPC